MSAPLTTADRIAAYILAIEKQTGKTVTRAEIEGRAIVLEFDGCTDSAPSTNPADLVTP